MRFLIIDDSVTMRRIIANILVRLGYPDVVHAANGREALERLGTEPVDVVITDWYMPEMNGLDFVKILRTTPATSHIPIMIVTANAASDDIQHALELGVKGYILKPFTVETMKDKIDALMLQVEPSPRQPVQEAPPQADAAAETEPAPAAGVENEPLMEPEPDFDTPPELSADSDQELSTNAPPDLAGGAAESAEASQEVVA